jgi:outer membrane lipoprotein-sorting protein
MGLKCLGVCFVVVLWVGFTANTTLAAADPVLSAADWGLPQLMQALARVKSASAQFTEHKTVHMLNAPLVTSGTLTYIAPDHMQKITVSPTPERFALDGDQVTIVSGPENVTHSFSVTDYPQIGGLVEGIRATLAGDLASLDRFYSVQLTGTLSDWQLLLEPKDGELARFIKWVRILGTGDRIRAINTEESDGDHSEMTVLENVQDRR